MQVMFFPGLERAPVAVGAGADADKGGEEDGGSEDGCEECEVHGVLLSARGRIDAGCGAVPFLRGCRVVCYQRGRR